MVGFAAGQCCPRRVASRPRQQSFAMSHFSYARACGIDFGTSNSTVGWLRSGCSTLLPLEDGKTTLPSVVFFNAEENSVSVGRAGLREYLEGYEGRLMRSLKSLLGSSLIDGRTDVQGTVVIFRDLLTRFIASLKTRAEAQGGRAFNQVVLGRPVFFVDDDPAADRVAEQTLADIARSVGFSDISFSTSRSLRPFTMRRRWLTKNWCWSRILAVAHLIFRLSGCRRSEPRRQSAGAMCWPTRVFISVGRISTSISVWHR